MKPIIIGTLSFLALGFSQCKPTTGSSSSTTKSETKIEKEKETPQSIVWANSDWQIINVYDEAAKREFNISAAPYLLHLTDQQWAIKLDKNKCNTTYTLSEDKTEITVPGMGCTRICCDGDAGKALAAAMAVENIFKVENATIRNGWVLLKSPKLTLRLRPSKSDSTGALKPTEKVPQTLVGTWFAVHGIEGGKTVNKYGARKHAITFYDKTIGVKLDVNDCSTEAQYTDSQIICPADKGMSCTKMCCDEVKGLSIFMGELTYKFKDNFLILTTKAGYQLWLQR